MLTGIRNRISEETFAGVYFRKQLNWEHLQLNAWGILFIISGIVYPIIGLGIGSSMLGTVFALTGFAFLVLNAFSIYRRTKNYLSPPGSYRQSDLEHAFNLAYSLELCGNIEIFEDHVFVNGDKYFLSSEQENLLMTYFQNNMLPPNGIKIKVEPPYLSI